MVLIVWLNLDFADVSFTNLALQSAILVLKLLRSELPESVEVLVHRVVLILRHGTHPGLVLASLVVKI